ncbi:MAG: prolyl oligopeptidase family serine peptidase [Steroidobacteraceae bacterium]
MSIDHSASSASSDPHAWLEGIESADAMTWVRTENQRTCSALEASPFFASLQRDLLAVLDSRERIPAVTSLGGLYYNFWRDEEHVRGILRRATAEEFRKPEPAWEIVLDIDALAQNEGENWVFAGITGLYPGYERFLVSLSRGGGDTVVVREYDVIRRTFPAAGFFVPAAKTHVGWIDVDTIYVGTDFGAGSLTHSGYPRMVKRWTRGTLLSEAPVAFEGQEADVGVWVARERTWVADKVHWIDTAIRRVTFHTSEKFVAEAGAWVKLDIPDDAEGSFFQDQVLMTLKSDWGLGQGTERRTWPRGAVLACPLRAFLDGRRDFQLLYEPGVRKSLAGLTATRHYLLVHERDEMRNRVREWRLSGDCWRARDTTAAAEGTLALAAIEQDAGDDYFMTHADPLTPTTLWYCRAGSDEREPLKHLPAFFDASGMKVSGYEAVAKDGTRIPYCVVTPKNFTANGQAPTLLYAYGGFEISLLPLSYAPARGVGWVSRGGVFVVAGIRGGGEFGPAWHQAALKSKRQTSYEDFFAVSEDLISRGITSSAHLGIQGGSNGGLMVGAVMLQRPDLYGAVVCQVPLLDMKRFHRLLAGASWMAEFGNPDDPTEWEFISRYSPYHNVSAERRYPRVLFITSTRDDRVHPGHARKMMARMKEQGHDVWYFENTEGGHALAANNGQAAKMMALEFTFLWEALR